MLELEKKYKLTKPEFLRLKDFFNLKFRYTRKDKELNTLYLGDGLNLGEVLRIREIKHGHVKAYIVTHKSKQSLENGNKSRMETEFTTTDSTVLDFFFHLGYYPNLKYEKVRHGWEGFPNVLINLDVLPFGQYMELEEIQANSGRDIKLLEEMLPIRPRVEDASYPELTVKLGKIENSIHVASFSKLVTI